MNTPDDEVNMGAFHDAKKLYLGRRGFSPSIYV